MFQPLPLLDDLIGRRETALGADLAAYRNHCQRVAHFCLAFSETEATGRIAVAAAFHDLGIWNERSLDYLAASHRLARDYLLEHGRHDWIEDVDAMIANHHKLTRSSHALAEAFRRADWIDVSNGRLRFGLSRDVIAGVQAAFPNAGFHRRLLSFIKQRFRTHPLRPLPMMKL